MGRSRLILSLLLHCLLVLAFLDLPLIFPASDAVETSAYYRRKATVYRMPLLAPNKTLPRVAPVGPGGRPGSGSEANRLPAVGRIGFAGRRTVIYKPLHPDNFRQTIRQPDPPDLKITQAIRVPDILFGNLHEPRRPVLHLEVKNAKPMAQRRQTVLQAVPTPDLESSITSSTTVLQFPSDRPHPPLEALSASKPVLREGTGKSGVPIPDDARIAGMVNGVVVLSVNPGWSTSQPTLPSGNREGAFAISPAGGRNGSPRGLQDGVIGGSTVNNQGDSGNAAGDGSTGPGRGNGGGGGGSTADAGALTINGTRGAAESAGVLRSNFIESLVYPVEKAALRPRKSQLVVSSGPMGGGGLNIYGTLHCGKIYTVFLEMPGKNWPLQFCQHREKKENTVNQNQSAVVHLEEALMAPYAETKFDFRRLPVPEKDSRKLIVLKGIVQEDGTVDKLQIYKGVLSEMDEAARLALSRWKFRPATRAQVPVPVDILVGIPVQIRQPQETN